MFFYNDFDEFHSLLLLHLEKSSISITAEP